MLSGPELKSTCEEIFSEYKIVDFKIVGSDAIIKLKEKPRSSNNHSKITNSMFQTLSKTNLRLPV